MSLPRLQLSRHHQALPGRGRQQRCVADGAARRDPCGARRERRRQVHADEDHLRLGQAGCRQRGPSTASPVHIRNPQEARAMGISMVFQHFSLFDTITVAENVWLGLDKSLSRWTPSRAASSTRRASTVWTSTRRALCTRSGVGEMQRVEIIRALLTQSAVADPGRADFGADAAGGREAVRRAEASWPRRAAASCTSATSCTRSARCAPPAPCCAVARSPASAILAEESNASLERG
jgi:hypothetical protein